MSTSTVAKPPFLSSVSAVAAVVGAAVILLAVPYPGSLSVQLYGWIAPRLSELPGIGAPAVAGLGALAVLLGVLLARAWGRDPVRFARGAAAAIGVPLAYLLSEGLKLLFAQERPCRAVAELPECPPIGDWSLPSNHSTVAFALFFAIALVGRGWVPWIAAVLAVVVGWGRVAEGVHYPHDVAAGALLGIAAVAVAAAALTKPVARVSARVRARLG